MFRLLEENNFSFLLFLLSSSRNNFHPATEKNRKGFCFESKQSAINENGNFTSFFVSVKNIYVSYNYVMEQLRCCFLDSLSSFFSLASSWNAREREKQIPSCFPPCLSAFENINSSCEKCAGRVEWWGERMRGSLKQWYLRNMKQAEEK